MSDQGAFSMFRRSVWYRHRQRALFGVCSVVALYGGRGLQAQQPESQSVASHDGDDGQRRTKAVLERRITVAFDNISLKRAIDSIAHAANRFVQYRLPLVQAYADPVSLHVVDLPIGVALERVLNGTQLRVIVDGQGEIAVVPLKEAATPDSVPAAGIVTGRVVDSATGKSIGGATITVAGTKLSAIASDSGRFTVRNVPSGEQAIVVRMFGYRASRRIVQITGDESTTLRIVLAAAPNVLSGVVTTATGVQDRKTVGNDITVLNADSIMRTAPISSVTDLLENHVPGLTVTRSSGVPGAPSRIRLRGVGGGLAGGNNTSNDPIVIVDGAQIYARESTGRDRNLAPPSITVVSRSFSSGAEAPSALDQIDPNSIETIEIFKGPSATSQWGAEAGNGVIVITTKSGHAGPAKISVALDAGIETMPGRYASPGYYPFGQQFFSTEASRYCGAFGESCVAVDTVIPFQGTTAARLSPFATGATSNGSVTLSGGANSVTYSLTASAGSTLGDFKMPDLYQDMYLGRYGTRPPSWMRRPLRYQNSGISASIGIVPTPGFHLTLQGALTNSTSHQTNGEENLVTLSGQYLDTLYLLQDTAGAAANLASYVQRSVLHTTVSTMTANADWSRWSRFPVAATASVSTSDRVDQTRVPFGYLLAGSVDTLGYYGAGHGNAVTRTSSATMTLFRGSPISAATGVSVVSTATDDFHGSTDTLSPGEVVPGAFSHSFPSTFSSTTAGWFIEPRLNMSSRLFVSPGFRFDGGSASSGASRSGNGRDGILALFPKLNFSWIAIDREGQAPFAGIVTTLRPRLAFGVAGVQPDPAWNRRLVTTSATGTGASGNSAQLLSIGNTQLHPERSHEVEGGFDAVLWGGRANLTMSLYNKTRTDAIQDVGTAPSIGGGMSYYANIGRIRNTGTEITFDARLIETGLVAWGVNMSVSTNRNLVMSLYQNIPTVVDGALGTRIVQGYPLGGSWARPILGYHDNDGDGRIGLSEVAVGDSAVYLGAPYPKAEIPFGTNVSLWHGRVGIHMDFNYKNGVTQFNPGGSLLLANRFWSPNATLGEQAIAVSAFGCGFVSAPAPPVECEGTLTNYGLYQTVNLLRFSTMSLNVTVPPSLSARVGVPSMTVALQGRNLGLWSNYRGKDPDVNGTPSGETLVDGGQIPLPRTWSIRFTLGN